ncbi:MAG TPA: hypothetical protein VN838_15710 [Bradyrhizobium sp.]|nr:hypothetical protein [Bradyrhizobium sp.]
MTDSTEFGAATPTPAMPAPASSLTGDAASARALIQGWIGDRESPYWKGNAEMSADAVQIHYRDLLRGEQSGSTTAVGPVHAVDLDLPVSVKQYDLAEAHGSASMTALDREIVDRFLPVAFAAGLGQRKVSQAVGWCLTIQGITVRQFEDLAAAAGWSDKAISTCLDWYRLEKARLARGMSLPPAADAPGRAALVARKAEIEGLMYVDGKPNPAYFRGPLSAEYGDILRALGAS